MLLTVLTSAAFTCAAPQVDNGYTFRCGDERIRIASIVTPELPNTPECKDHRRAYAWCDYRAGFRSRDELRRFLSRGPVLVERLATDRYGRTLARVSVNGQDASEYLVARGLAKRWR